MKIKIEIINLYRYFGYAAHMRTLYVHEMSEKWLKLLSEDKSKLIVFFFFTAPGIYLMYSYAAMYVLIEGWRELKLADSRINTLLDSPYVDRLRLFRNATFHFQKDPMSEKHFQFFGTEEELTEKWLNSLYSEFERFFRENTLAIPSELKETLKDKTHVEVSRLINEYWKRQEDAVK